VKIFHNSIAKFPFYTGIENRNFSKRQNSRFLPALKTGIFQNGEIPVIYWHRKREFFKMAKFPFSTGIENGNFSKWRNSRFLPALKMGIFQNGGIPVFYRH
jgi:hypothetical protein